ncbi:MAG: crossover junction endodeoxyribonuclease RuvC [Gammaproteobacteria bacterium]|nr:crossover junction endodeoxyribonuclease RuvC [Gammaproteobacteria bacterium]
MTTVVRILGIDPGSQVTGYGIVEHSGAVTRPVAWGGIKTNGSHPERLKQIYVALGRIVAEHAPDEIAIERVFLHRNADSALKLGQARAAALCATFSLDLPIHEYAARHIKKALVGNGGAQKAQVQHMVKIVLGLREKIEADAADALAAAVCHAHQRGVNALVAGAKTA